MKNKISVLIIEGASASSMRKSERTASILQGYLTAEHNVEVTVIPRSWAKTKCFNAILDFFKTANRRVLVVGKSQGGDRLLQWLNEFDHIAKSRDIRVLTIDPRNWSDPGISRRLPNMQGINVYQRRSAIKGYLVNGAQNFLIDSDQVNHFNIVRSQTVENCFLGLLEQL